MEMPDWFREMPWTVVLGVIVVSMAMQLHSELKRREKWEEIVIGDMDEIVEWLKEIDSRMDEEKRLLEQAWESVGEESLSDDAPMLHMQLEEEKQKKGERTLLDPLRREWRRKQEEESKK